MKRYNQKGGLFDKSKKVKPVSSSNDYDLKDIQLIGEGGFGVVGLVQTPVGPVAVKLIKSATLCRSAKMECDIHNQIYQTYVELGQYVGHYQSYDILYIPKPLFYMDYDTSFQIKVGHRVFDTSCSYTMEYMKPINIETNVFHGQPIQLHIV